MVRALSELRFPARTAKVKSLILVRLIQQQRVARLLIGKDCFAFSTNMPARPNIPVAHENRIDKPTGGKRNALLFTGYFSDLPFNLIALVYYH